MAETITAPAAPTFQAMPNKFHVAEWKRVCYVLEVPAETPLAEIMNPGALSACLQRNEVKRFNRIEVHGGDEWWAELLVTRVDTLKKRIYTKILNKAISTSVNESAIKNDPLKVEKMDKTGKYRVLRGTKDLGEFATKAEAEAFATQV